jgi:endonuclease G
MKKFIVVILVIFISLCDVLYAQTSLEIPISKGVLYEQIITRQNYTLSYNGEINLPNWVAWSLDKRKLAEVVSRKGFNFRPDPDMDPKEAVVTQDYAHSGYDRGHMCPAGDSRWSAQAMKESFYIAPLIDLNERLLRNVQVLVAVLRGVMYGRNEFFRLGFISTSFRSCSKSRL